MKKSLLYIWMLPLLIVSIAVVGVRAQSTTIGVEPQSIVDPGLVPGSWFTVDVAIRDIEDLAGIEYKLGYDTSVLTATGIEYGGIFGPTYIPYIDEIYDADGYLHHAFLEMPTEPSFDGDGRVATINFTVDSLGASVLNLYDTKLGSPGTPYPVPIIHNAEDGFFSNVAVHDIAAINVTVYPTEVEAGESVTINVTVTNEGDYNETFTVDVYADIIAYEPIYHPTTRELEGFDVVVGDEITVGTQTVTDLAPGNTTTPTFTWNTTAVEEGNYTISARATPVTGETETDDNLFVPLPLDVPPFSPPSVIVRALPFHDIAITSVVPSPTEVDVGDTVTIDVTVTNEGDYNETFSVTVYYDGTAIDTETSISLENGTSTTLNFTWNTNGVEEGTYTIKAEASVVTGETDTDDNTKTDGTVEVLEAAPAPNILLYVAVAAVAIVIIAAVVIYFVKIRK